MALETNLLKFKSSGVKQILEVAEASPTTTLPSGARLLVINSRKGRVNYPIAIQDFTDYKTKFDNINDADERRGNFGARTAQMMLRQGPIYVLNLRQFDNTVDTAGIVELSSAFGINNNDSTSKSYKKLFNTQQFWKIDNSALLNATNTDKLLVFGNIGVQALSIFVRKTKVTNFNQTFETWYNMLGREMPAYVQKSDKVSDWMIDIHVFANNFGVNSFANTSYGFCFNADGNVRKTVVNSSQLEIDGIKQLSAIPESNFIGTFTGSLIQGFTDETGNNLDIIDIINSYVEKTGLIVARNEEIFDEAGSWFASETAENDGQKQPVPVDFKGHNLVHIDSTGKPGDFSDINGTSMKTLSYSSVGSIDELTNDVKEITSQSLIDTSKTVVKLPIVFSGTVTANGVEALSANKFIVIGKGYKPSIDSTYAAFDGNLATVKNVSVVGKFASLTNANNEKLAIQPFNEDVAFADSRNWFVADGLTSTFTYTDSGKVFPKNGNGSYYVYPVGHPLAGLPLAFEKHINGVASNVIHNPNPIERQFVLAKNAGMTIDEYCALVIEKNSVTAQTQQIVGYSDISLDRVKASSNASTLLTLLSGKLNDEYVYEVTTDKNLAVENIAGTFVDTSNLAPLSATDEDNYIIDDNGKKIYFYDPATVIVGFKIHSAEECTTEFVPINLKSYVPRNRQFLDGTADRQNEVLSVLSEISIDNGLQNQDLINWMYLVDGFKSYIEPNIKYQLKDVAKKRITARAIYNLPFIKDLAKSTNPYFSSEIGGDLEMKYVAEGGNFELPYSNSLGLPTEDGYHAYGFSAIEMTGGKIVPSAGLVSNLFARKHQLGKPYGILAGNPDGVLTMEGLVGPEYVFIEKNDGTGDRDYLEPAGWNLIIRKNRLVQIYSNKTSFTTVNSPVSSIHTSEVVMFLQLRIKSLLDNFVFKYNTANNRLRIVEQANDICDEPLGAGAISNYVNKMDTVNNNREVIANRIGVLDTTIYANNGMEIIVHRTKIDIETNTATFEIL